MSPPTFLLLLLLITPQIRTTAAKTSVPKFPAILVFGDSTVDSGNNNHIHTFFRGNHQPYGGAFPGRLPTGRFSDGKLVPDLLASIIGLKESVPPFLDPSLSDEDLVTGVSFASAGSGFDDLTSLVSLVIPMSKQPAYFREYIKRLNGVVGEEEARAIVAGALVVVSAGTNDFLFNYYDMPSTRRFEFTIDQYQNWLHNRLKHLLKELYELGCRKILVSGLPPIGCLPIQMTIRSPPPLRNCSEKENEESRSYNDKLQKLLPLLQTDLPGSRILYVDVYNPLATIIHNPQKYGFVKTERGCCGSGLVEVGPLCNELTPVCQNPSQYIFYDCIHPTESTSRIVANQIAQLLLQNF
ncbi:hypothetical protein ACS0TY_008017 [Phlomoides rotata]